MLKILCVGYPRTGTRSLWQALTLLGYKALHHDDERIPLHPPMGYCFRQYDDVDAATEEVYWREVLKAYEDQFPRIILTTRSEDAWWQSVRHVVWENRQVPDPAVIARFDFIQQLLYGAASPVELLYRKRYREHREAVQDYCRRSGVPCLLFDAGAGDGWTKLCRFLDDPVPPVPYPWENRRSPPP
jgi:hypothetical protein